MYAYHKESIRKTRNRYAKSYLIPPIKLWDIWEHNARLNTLDVGIGGRVLDATLSNGAMRSRKHDEAMGQREYLSIVIGSKGRL